MRAARKRAGYSLVELGDLVGVTSMALSGAERGSWGLSPEVKVRIARVLKIRVRDLFPVEPVTDEPAEATA